MFNRIFNAPRTRLTSAVLGTLVSVLLVFSCPPSARAGQLNIVATTGMIADAAAKIGGDSVAVHALMGPGVDPHAYRQTRSDIVAMTKADLILWHGLFLEAQMEDFFRKLGKSRNVVAVAEAMPEDQLIAHDVYANKYDPHVWMDPGRWLYVAEAIRDALIEAQPEHKAVFEANTAAYLQEIAALDTFAAEVLATVPKDNRVLVTAHDAFNYFGDAYDFDVIGIQGISTQSEAGLHRVAELVDLLVERKIKAVFVESSVSDRSVRALIEGAAARGHEIVIGGSLYSDAMGEPETYEGTYLGMIDHNVTTIARALGGQAPQKGRLGQLAVTM
ncbi:metal ABC transporter solute-binding protein, Zn/Mn family [Roseibium marinum]|uniref:Manganese/zinc/iron transport system substrate-binding protein n=1 Tax=Roseibium marinum TaxID=281252 RepID=A0A2S3ULR7_9HYPH|nr:zinc ABC transporter substrate-binding protein [Roseibium marinum]POF28510.1 manganese/zinc/iron transport system substrate-binding protein [Roseibium marinum]